jgi:ABC-2 type transport system permease protein
MSALGLLISTQTRNQFAASQGALVVGFLPAFELSGFLFEIDAMPAPLRLFTYAFPPRYFVSGLQTLFLVGDVPEQLLPQAAVLLGFAVALFAALVWVTPVRLE